MSNQKKSHLPDDFYIGYHEKAPQVFRKRIRLFILGAAILVPLVAFFLVMNQNPFSTGTFELGNQSQLTGILSSKPVPVIKMINGRDLFGNPVYQTIPLINFGKFGAVGLLQKFEKQIGSPLEEVEATIAGTLIYRDGKTLFELTKQEAALLSTSRDLSKYDVEALKPNTEELGQAVLKGEIVDPKCYFGVMKPGEGKPHRSCASLCIKGGIPPVFVTTNETGAHSYFLILGEKGEMINEKVLDYVAIQSEMKGRLVRYDDWMILYTNPESGISPI